MINMLSRSVPVANVMKMSFSAAKRTPKQSRVKEKVEPCIFNDNLMFPALKHDMFLLPHHPKIISFNGKRLDIDSKSIVLEMSFIKRAKAAEGAP